MFGKGRKSAAKAKEDGSDAALGVVAGIFIVGGVFWFLIGPLAGLGAAAAAAVGFVVASLHRIAALLTEIRDRLPPKPADSA